MSISFAVSMKCQTRPSLRFSSSSSSSVVYNLSRCSAATTSICSSTTFTIARMLPTMRTFVRILPTPNSSKLRAFSDRKRYVLLHRRIPTDA